MKRLSFFFLLLSQGMTIDENTLGRGLSGLFLGFEPIEITQSNYMDYRYPNYEYCSGEDLMGVYDFYGFKVERFAAKINKFDEVREVLLVVKTHETELFYETVNKRFGTPSSSRLSKFYIEKHGFQIPPKVDKKSLDSYYKNLPKPTIRDFPDLKSLAWYNIRKNNINSPSIDLIIRNKTSPDSKFLQKEIWVILKQSKD